MLTDGILKIEGTSYRILNLIIWHLRVKIGCVSFFNLYGKPQNLITIMLII